MSTPGGLLKKDPARRVMLIPQAREKHLFFLIEKNQKADPSPAPAGSG
jgi:hypothetical protein